MLKDEPHMTKQVKFLLKAAQQAAAREGESEMDVKHVLYAMATVQNRVTTPIMRVHGLGDVSTIKELIGLAEAGLDIQTAKVWPVMTLLVSDTGEVVNANEPAQRLLDQHGNALRKRLKEIKISPVEQSFGDRKFVISTNRLSDTSTSVTIRETTPVYGYDTDLQTLFLSVLTEFRTQMTHIMLAANLLSKLVVLDERGLKYIDMLNRGVSDLEGMLGSVAAGVFLVIGLAKGVEQQPCNLVNMLNTLPKSGWPKDKNPNLKITVGDTGDGWRVWGDHQLVRRLMFSLAEHGLRRTPEGQAVTITLDRDDEGMWLRFWDTGTVLPDDIHDRAVYQSYFERDGMMRLDVAEAIIRAHGGRLEYRNLPGDRAAVNGMVEFAVLFPKEIVIAWGGPD